MNCGLPGNNVHHLIPLSKGGPDDPEFWVLLCEKCHKMKGLHSEQRFYIELATKKFYAESLKAPRIEIPVESVIIGPQENLNLLRFHTPKDPPEAKIEASTRIAPAKPPRDWLRNQKRKELYTKLLEV